MLQVDYEISRKEGEGNDRTFYPDVALKIIESNAVYLEAPNAKGKSSLLNVLAISLYGHKLDGSDSRISPTLKSNIEYMMQREDQAFTFDVRFSSKNGAIQLISIKNNPKSNDIVIQEINNGKSRVLPFQVFRDEYYLVYDIPENPLNRLKEILIEVDDQQDRYKKKVSGFKEYLEEIKKQLARSRDENAIQDLKLTITSHTMNIEELEANINKVSEEIKIIEPFYALRGFVQAAKTSASLTDTIERKGKEIKKFEKSKKRHNTVYSKKKRDLERMIGSVGQQMTQLSIQLENIFIESGDMKLHVEDFQKIEFYRAIETYKVNPAINKELEYFTTEINRYKERKEVREAARKGEFFEDILKILETYRGIDIFIPGTDKNIVELINLIRPEYEKNKEYTDIYMRLNQCNTTISQIKQTVDSLPRHLDSLKVAFNKQQEMSETAPEPQEIDNEIERLSEDLEKELTKTRKYARTAEKYGFKVNDMDEITIQKLIQQIVDENNQFLRVFQQDENKISELLNELSGKIIRLSEDKSRVQQMVDQYNQRLSDFENREKHKYDAYVSEIEEISSIVDSLEFDLISYKKLLNSVRNGEKLKDDLGIKYNDQISQYLALKIPEFPYIDEFVRPVKIDFILQKIYMDTGREIDMKDISTGQAMSMYIQTILNRPSDDKRKLIVIFDEASTMDSNSFQPIKRTLERLIENNRLIFALFARAIDGDMKITEIA
ncbi:MAG: AAA family ATPase [Paludibacter sp.]|nr:AAA family ATPase [Paludibacter sp.]